MFFFQICVGIQAVLYPSRAFSLISTPATMIFVPILALDLWVEILWPILVFITSLSPLKDLTLLVYWSQSIDIEPRSSWDSSIMPSQPISSLGKQLKDCFIFISLCRSCESWSLWIPLVCLSLGSHAWFRWWSMNWETRVVTTPHLRRWFFFYLTFLVSACRST